MAPAPLLSISRLRVHYPVGRRRLVAIDDISLTLHRGETLAIVGESGCGKSTLARAICGLTPATAGKIEIEGEPIDPSASRAVRQIGRRVQYVFQDPLDALDPSMTIGQILDEPLRHHFPGLSRQARRRRVEQAAEDVAVSRQQLDRYPHEFSGGQAQRIGIARALVSEPSVLICDEPVSALDVSIQAQIINLLRELQRKRQLAMVFISHDLRVVRQMADRMMVLYLGRVMESGPADTLFEAPRHPYTRALLAAVPREEPAAERQRIATLEPLVSELPSPLDPPSGCVFRTRCPEATAACADHRPATAAFGEPLVNCLLAQ